jgi:hypothetical protein
MMNYLNIDFLNLEKKKYNKYDTYNEILESCHKKIKSMNKNKYKTCYYVPPKILFGKPLYDYKDMILYLIERLDDNGLLVYWDNDKQSLYISWDINDINYDKYNKKNLINNKSSYAIVNHENFHDIIPVNMK